MNWLFVISFVSTIAGITPVYIQDHIFKYFNSAVVKRSAALWRNHIFAFQNSLSSAMQESYGSKGMNVYVKRPPNPLHISTGYYHYDNQVHIVLQGLNLEDFPHLSDPLIRFPIAANVIKIEAVVSRMQIHANYIQFRNTSSVAYDQRDQNSYLMSPFLFEQVKNVGQLAITVEGCKLSGIGITSLTGRSVNLGNTVFRLINCHFNFEIFTPGVATPPVVADYLPNSEGLNLEHLIMRPMQAELIPKLQATLHTLINTSSIFRDTLPQIRVRQALVFEQTTNYINNVIRNLNMLTITRNMGRINMEDFSIRWNDTFDEGPINSVLNLNNMILTGLETVYSSHTGGPIRLTTLKIAEELRYGTLQVRGSINLQSGDTTKGMHDFAVEISDVEVDVTIALKKDPNQKTPPTSVHGIEVMGWRSAQFSSPGMSLLTGEAFIIGYLLTKVPIHLANHLNALLDSALREADKEYQSFDSVSLGGPVPGGEDGN